MIKNRRKKFVINRPLQLRFMAYISLPLLVITLVVVVGLYLGIWGSVLEMFSEERLRYDVVTASRLTEYEEARQPPHELSVSNLSFFKQTERLSERQRILLKEILNETHRKNLPYFILILVFIAWGSVYLSHKIAGPLYRYHKTLEEIDRGNLRIRIRLRKNDEGQELVNSFNNTIENLDIIFSKIKNIIKENESNPERMASRLKEELAKIKTSVDF